MGLPRFAILLALGLSCTLQAQTLKTVTSPKGFLNQEGASGFYLTDDRRVQVQDESHIGSAAILLGFALRRDGPAFTRESGGTVDVILNIGLGKGLNRFEGLLDRNYVGTPTTVFSKTKMSFPDWTKAPANFPAPFDFSFALKKVFLYPGKTPLIWDLTWKNAKSKNGKPHDSMCDHAFWVPTTFTSGFRLSPGCGNFQHIPTAMTAGQAAGNGGMAIVVRTHGAPPLAPVFLSVDFRDAAATLTGWCAKLHAYPRNVMLLGTSDSVGNVPGVGFAIPYSMNLEGFRIYSQLFANSSAGLVLSDGRRSRLMRAGTVSGTPSVYGTHPLSLPYTTSSIRYGGGPIVRLTKK